MNCRRPLPLTLAALAIAACGGNDDAARPPATATAPAVAQPSATEQAATARRQIVKWLECEECVDGELEAVRTLGQNAVPTLAASLRDGASPATREKLRLNLVDTYRGMRDYADKNPEANFSLLEPEFIRRHLENQDSRYRARSAQALAAIGGNEAREVLQDMAGFHLLPEVQAEVSEALSRIPGP